MEDEVRDKVHSHDVRITIVEVNQEVIKEKVDNLVSDRKKAIWLILSVLISGLTYAALSGLGVSVK